MINTAYNYFNNSVFGELRSEAYQIKYYIQKRFKDITSIIKSHPTLACTSLLVLAWSIYSITLPIFIFPIIITVDYLDNTYFYRNQTSRSTLFALFLDLDLKQNYHSVLSSEVREDLKDDPELLHILEEGDQIFLEQHQSYKNDPRPVVLFLKAKSDHNGALDLYTKDNGVTINGDNNQGVTELEKKYKIVVIDNITNINEIKDELEKITNTIQHVWILAHGTPTSMLLDGNNKIENDDIDYLADIMQEKLSEDAHVVLYSCSTGKKIFWGENIATKFSKILPGRTIWAPKLPTGIVNLDLGEDDFSIKVSFCELKSRWKFLQEKLWNICCLRPFKKIELELNVTAQIKDGEECL